MDIDQRCSIFVADRGKKEGVTNIRTVLGEYDDPKLPVKDVDVAFFHRVLHMIEHRQPYLNTTVDVPQEGWTSRRDRQESRGFAG